MMFFFTEFKFFEILYELSGIVLLYVLLADYLERSH